MRAKYLFLKCVGYFFGFLGNFGSRFTIWYSAIFSSILRTRDLRGCSLKTREFYPRASAIRTCSPDLILRDSGGPVRPD